MGRYGVTKRASSVLKLQSFILFIIWEGIVSSKIKIISDKTIVEIGEMLEGQTKTVAKVWQENGKFVLQLAKRKFVQREFVQGGAIVATAE